MFLILMDLVTNFNKKQQRVFLCFFLGGGGGGVWSFKIRPCFHAVGSEFLFLFFIIIGLLMRCL